MIGIHSPTTTRSSRPSPSMSRQTASVTMPTCCELRRELRGDVGEVARPVVLQQHALRIDPVAARHDAAADEEIDRAIAVVVGRDDA